eukprot:TRINITY_DN8783_c0_g1_i1.p2 TRINITY_DN8783_c0_g1~~TRINITY_DN8783_c0_g1_i1.p2  ORF type:complete len:464 (+),score=90.76 TRINITY_DN8783_c0_g1_i1:136-1392(+)
MALAADSLLDSLKGRSTDFIEPDAAEWNEYESFDGDLVFPAVGRLCFQSAPKRWPPLQRFERLRLCEEIDRRSLRIRLTLAMLHADFNDVDKAEEYLQAITDEAYQLNEQGIQPSSSDQVHYAGAIGGLVMLKRNHPSNPDPVAAAEEFFRANNTLEYVNWADTMTVCPFFNASLRSMPWWDEPELLPGLAELERRIDVMRTELETLLDRADALFTVQADTGVVAKGSWTECIVWEHGHFDAEHCMHLPWMCLYISYVPLITGWQRHTTEFDLEGQASILKMTPGTHLRVHTGGTNARITVQLPLIVPEGIVFRVANETRTYTAGSALVFDDCYEHEVQHLGATDRYVLYLTARHPDLGLDMYRPDWYDEKLLSIAQEAHQRGLMHADDLGRYKAVLEEFSQQDQTWRICARSCSTCL